MSELFRYEGELYPDYIRHGNAMRFIAPTALEFCKGEGLDIGAGRWPLAGAVPIELHPADIRQEGQCAMSLPPAEYNFIFSSHCLEHLVSPVAALEHWKTRLRVGGVLFLYLPHPEMGYWRPENCRKHLHLFWPADVAKMLRALGFVDVIHGERDLAWGFAVVGFNGRAI